MSAPGGLVTFVGCDFFAPCIFNCVTVAWFGGNLGGIVSANGGASQTRSIYVAGAWVYDGGSPYTYCPVDCCSFSTTGIIAGGSLGTMDDANAAFTATDVGKDIIVLGAGPSGAPLSTTIATRASATEITLTASASQAGTYSYYFPGGTTAGGSGMYLANVTLVDCHIDCAVVQYAANGILPSANKLSYLGKCVVSRLAGNTVGASNPTYLLKGYSGTSDTTTVVDGVQYAQTDGSHIGVRTGGSATHGDDVRCLQAPGSNVVAQTVQATAPSVPATTVAQTNPYGVAMIVTVTGGTVTVIAVNGVTTGLTSGAFMVPSGGTITLTYSIAPTWTWTQFSAYAAAPAASGTVTGPDVYGASAVVGTAATFSRGDHDHGLPAAPAVSLTTGSSFITMAVVLTTGGTAYNVTSVSLAAGTWLISAMAVISSTGASLGATDIWIGPNSASTTGAYGATGSEVTGHTGVNTDLALSLTQIVVLASPATVYLNAASATALANVLAASPEESLGNVSGMTAVKIA